MLRTLLLKIYLSMPMKYKKYGADNAGLHK